MTKNKGYSLADFTNLKWERVNMIIGHHYKLLNYLL